MTNILTEIEETFKKKGVKLTERTNIAIQFGNFSAKYLTNKGGRIRIPGSRVSLYVPPGALDTTPTLVYIYLHPRSSRKHSLGDNRTRLTPNVECGPHGLVFKKDVYLTMPHYAVTPSKWDFDGHQTKEQTDGQKCTKSVRDAVVVSEYEVTIMLDHFCTHQCSGQPSNRGNEDVRKWMKAGISFHGQDDQHVQIKVQLCDIDEIENFIVSIIS